MARWYRFQAIFQTTTITVDLRESDDVKAQGKAQDIVDAVAELLGVEEAPPALRIY
jgi:hypothetical protein